ncbi:MAG: YhbY family RNA-binding protein [Acholeplasmatales bacterium]|nr:YhbY family RNA-binding protein [Acholeplasmatales bacterium]
MLTGKQKVYLRGLANGIKPVMQIGKGGLSEETVIAVLQYLNKHELMKVSILQNSDTTLEELDAAFSAIEVEVVQKIGKTIVLYKHSDNVDEPIKLPKVNK